MIPEARTTFQYLENLRRQTGRTYRMLRAARMAAENGKRVLVVVTTPKVADALAQKYPAVAFRSREEAGLSFKDGILGVRPVAPEVWWDAVYVDHLVFQVEFQRIFEEFHRWDYPAGPEAW